METGTQELMSVQQTEIAAVADAMAQAFRKRVKYYIKECKMSSAEAIDHATAHRDTESWITQIQDQPSKQVSWSQLEDLVTHDEQMMWEKWQSIKDEATDMLNTGQLAADSLANTDPWTRARFLSIRHEMIKDWKPRNGIEQSLIDQMAICFDRFLEWQTALTTWSQYADFTRDQEKLPRLTTKEAVQHATDMIDRFNRMFLRTLRALRDLRRYNAPVIVQNAGQVNVAGQQVNVANSQQGNEQQ